MLRGFVLRVILDAAFLLGRTVFARVVRRSRGAPSPRICNYHKFLLNANVQVLGWCGVWVKGECKNGIHK